MRPSGKNGGLWVVRASCQRGYNHCVCGQEGAKPHKALGTPLATARALEQAPPPAPQTPPPPNGGVFAESIGRASGFVKGGARGAPVYGS
ncbi:MAG: hypothetical protein HW383_776 [Candidatus Magasanikbacteria bacterium]|nr:hypothetical protein [Candidatus Magasanikbacteria bacterium]